MTETVDTVPSSDFNEKEAMEDGQTSSQSNEDSQEIPSVLDPVAKSDNMDSESTDISREEDNSRSDSGVCSPSSSTDVKKTANGTETDKITIKPEDDLEMPKTPEADSIETWEKEITPTSDDSPQRPVISVRKSEDLFGMVNGSNEQCSVCTEKFSSPSALEQHRATAGHYNCSLPECSGLTFQTTAELGEHQAVHHQPPVQQLAQQVQRIPATFNSQSPYRSPTTPPPLHRYSSVPQTIGSGVVLSPVNPNSSSVPNLPPGIQLSKRPAPQPSESPVVKQRREEINQPPHIRLPDSITLVSRTPTQPSSQQRQRESVTDMLANRGITVVPSGRTQPTASSQPILPRQLNSAISITPSSQHRAGFVTPAPKAPINKLPTVDLTKESDSPRRSLNRGVRMRGPTGRSVCQICDKAFPTPTELSQHMACHRGGGMANKLAYECRECTAQYPTEAGLQAHRQKYHGAGGPSPDMAIPIVDLKQVGVLSRLAALGIRSVIPLSQLHSGSGSGMFGLPVVAVDSASNPAICNIGGMGASNLLPLGPLKNLTFNNNMR